MFLLSHKIWRCMLQKGDIIDVLSMSPSGMWQGRLNGCVGFFKFINVEMVPGSAGHRPPRVHHKGRPHSVEELLKRVNLQVRNHYPNCLGINNI